MSRPEHRLRHARLSQRRQTGVSLIELLIAAAIGAILLAGLWQVFVSNKRSYLIQEELSRLQESGRLAISALSTDIRASNFTTGATIEASIAGENNRGENGSDAITLKYQTDRDCNNSRVTTMTINRYYLSNNNLMCDGSGGRPQPLVANIVDMQILYGIDTDCAVGRCDGTANRYVEAGHSALNMDEVSSVRLSLLLRSAVEIKQQAQTVYYMGRAFMPSDRYAYHSFTTTISLRNR
ncbi:MAG: prepilin-type N-terminal cleavage/methylation domain-containing protein [Gammaproteobacteria bacterium]|nr:prepilin-type N-terminal cleavage/methylation domain-containing protein [Gammaproteobacteria bacterium]